MNFIQQVLLLEPQALGEFDRADATPSDAAPHESTQRSVLYDSGEIRVREAEAMKTTAANYPLRVEFATAGPARHFAVLNNR
jgi:hypothetical protein